MVCFYCTVLHTVSRVMKWGILSSKISYHKHNLKANTAALPPTHCPEADVAFLLNFKPAPSPPWFFRQSIQREGLHGVVQLQRAVGAPLACSEERLQPPLPAGLQLQGEWKPATRRANRAKLSGECQSSNHLAPVPSRSRGSSD